MKSTDLQYSLQLYTSSKTSTYIHWSHVNVRTCRPPVTMQPCNHRLKWLVCCKANCKCISTCLISISSTALLPIEICNAKNQYFIFGKHTQNTVLFYVCDMKQWEEISLFTLLTFVHSTISIGIKWGIKWHLVHVHNSPHVMVNILLLLIQRVMCCSWRSIMRSWRIKYLLMLVYWFFVNNKSYIINSCAAEHIWNVVIHYVIVHV